MSERPIVGARQLCMLLFLSLAVDMVIRSLTASGMPSAQKAIPAALLDAAIVSLLLIAPLRGQRLGTGAAWNGKAWGTKFLLFSAALLLAAAGAGAAARASEFFRYVSDEPLPALVIYAVFFAVVLYALRSGVESLARAAGIAAGIFLASMLLMLAPNLGGMRLFHLSYEPFDLPSILEIAARGFTLPPELLLLFLLRPCVGETERVPLHRTILALALFYIGLSFCVQAVLGPAAQSQTQTIHTLSRLGSLSVFRRLDALHIAAWMLAALCRLAALACGVRYATARLLPQGQRRYADRYAVGLLAAAVAVCSGVPRAAMNTALTVGTAALLVFMTGYGAFREDVYAKKNG